MAGWDGRGPGHDRGGYDDWGRPDYGKGGKGPPDWGKGPPDWGKGPPDWGKGPPDWGKGPPDWGQGPPDWGKGWGGKDWGGKGWEPDYGGGKDWGGKGWGGKDWGGKDFGGKNWGGKDWGKDYGGKEWGGKGWEPDYGGKDWGGKDFGGKGWGPDWGKGFGGYGFAKGGYPDDGWGPGHDPWGGPKGGCYEKGGGYDERPRSRTRSPLRERKPEDYVDAGAPLERHVGAVRDNRPAWMTAGLGVGKEMLGEATGELVKPGMTKKDLEEICARGPSDEPDPMADVFNEATNGGPNPDDDWREPLQQGSRQALPDQDAIFSTREGGPPPELLPPGMVQNGYAGGAPPIQGVFWDGPGDPRVLCPDGPFGKGGLPPIKHTNPNRFKEEICTFWLKGKCTRGESCTYAHGDKEVGR